MRRAAARRRAQREAGPRVGPTPGGSPPFFDPTCLRIHQPLFKISPSAFPVGDFLSGGFTLAGFLWPVHSGWLIRAIQPALALLGHIVTVDPVKLGHHFLGRKTASQFQDLMRRPAQRST